MSSIKDWLTTKLTPSKQTEDGWAELTNAIGQYFHDNLEPNFDRLKSLVSITSQSQEDLDYRIEELGELFSYEANLAPDDKALAVIYRMDEIHLKNTSFPITTALKREFSALDQLSWLPLYSRIDLETFPYGNDFRTLDELNDSGESLEDWFMTSRGVVQIALNDIYNMDMTREDFVRLLRKKIEFLIPTHIVFDGERLYLIYELKLNKLIIEYNDRKTVRQAGDMPDAKNLTFELQSSRNAPLRYETSKRVENRIHFDDHPIDFFPLDSYFYDFNDPFQMPLFNGLNAIAYNYQLDIDNLDFEFECYLNLNSDGVLIAQNISNVDSEKALELSVVGNQFQLIIGGETNTSPAITLDYGLWTFKVTNTILNVYKNGNQIISSLVTTGTAREPTARTTFFASRNGDLNSFTNNLSSLARLLKLSDHDIPVLDLPLSDGSKFHPVLFNTVGTNAKMQGDLELWRLGRYILRTQNINQHVVIQPVNCDADFEIECQLLIPSSSTGSGYVFSSGNESEIGLNLYANNDFNAGNGELYINGTSSPVKAVGLSSDEWLTFGAVYKNGTLFIVINRVVFTSQIVTMPNGINSATLAKLAESILGGEHLTALFKRLKIWIHGDSQSGQVLVNYDFADGDNSESRLVNDGIGLDGLLKSFDSESWIVEAFECMFLDDGMGAGEIAQPTGLKSLAFNKLDFLQSNNASKLQAILGRSTNGQGAVNAFSIYMRLTPAPDNNNTQTLLFFGDNDTDNRGSVKITYEGGNKRIRLTYGSKYNSIVIKTPIDSCKHLQTTRILVTYDGKSTENGSGGISTTYSRFNIYLNGIKQNYTKSNVNFGYSGSVIGDKFYIGREPKGNYLRSGTVVDEVAIFEGDRGSEAVAISQIPFNLATLLPPPQHLWRMGDGDTAPDILDNIGDCHLLMSDTMSGTSIVSEPV